MTGIVEGRLRLARGRGKALALEAFCRARGQAFVRFDYAGHGQSSGRFEEGTIGAWTKDALAVLDQVAQGPQIIVGSSMGGWIAPKSRPGAAGPRGRPGRHCRSADFTEDLIWRDLPPDAQMRLETDGVIYERSEYDDKPYPITWT